MSSKSCQDWNPWNEKHINPKILLVGHDPRLQSSDTIADYALFANYYFNPKPKSGPEKKKYELASNSFEQVFSITCNRYKAEEIYVTNLCNEPLDRSDLKGKTILIPEDIAKKGVERIKTIITQYRTTIEYIFPMSQQVNYWLQLLGLYTKDTDFLDKAKPKQKGIDNKPPYYEPEKPKAFLKICGNIYETELGVKVIPILHTKAYGKLKPYFKNYEQIKQHFSH